jgi:leucyl-tRNA synthetase
LDGCPGGLADRVFDPTDPTLLAEADVLFLALPHGESTGLVAQLPWLVADPALLRAETVTLAVQVLGKLRGTIEVGIAATREEIEALALADGNVARFMSGQSIRKVIVVPDRIVNIVAG